MLNELHQVSQALDRVGIDHPSRHPRINPMGKNRALLIVRLNQKAKPSKVEFVSKTVAATLFRVEHGSAGSSFPGFNIPTPLLDLKKSSAKKLEPVIKELCALQKKSDSPSSQIRTFVTKLVERSSFHQFTDSQNKQFKRSMIDLVEELQDKFSDTEPKLINFKDLLEIIKKFKPDLNQFSQNLTETLQRDLKAMDNEDLRLIQNVLFGVLDVQNKDVELCSVEYWKRKKEKDKNSNQPIYLDIANQNHNYKPVAHPDTSQAINAVMLRQQDRTESSMEMETDAFGYRGSLQNRYPDPKIAELGNVKLFSVNTKEVKALDRYGLEGSRQFPATTSTVQKMNDSLLYLAGESKKNITCRPIPGAQPGKRDLLISYLEESPDFQKELADLFGGEAQSFGDADFAARTQPVLEALDGKLQTDPNLKVQILTLCSLDKGRKQISLHRRIRVKDIVQAARRWKDGSTNVPTISIFFPNKEENKDVRKLHFTPHPLDLASIVNHVWSSDSKSGFKPEFQRAITTSDAYDVFFADGPISESKIRLCFSLLLYRMSPVLARLGAVKTRHDWTVLHAKVRWQCRKSISLLGILLHQLGYPKDRFMENSTYQIGRLLALADSLHFQYCKWVRTSDDKRRLNKVNAPSELLGNSLFNFALDNPPSALARLAERIRLYKGWADTYSGEDAGLVHWFVRQMGECEHRIDVTELPARMEDIQKAQLLLGYLADHSQTEQED